MRCVLSLSKDDDYTNPNQTLFLVTIAITTTIAINIINNIIILLLFPTACHWHTESHRYSPVNLNVISWLGVWYVKREMYDEAIEYFERAALVQPSEVKWQLMVSYSIP